MHKRRDTTGETEQGSSNSHTNFNYFSRWIAGLCGKLGATHTCKPFPASASSEGGAYIRSRLRQLLLLRVSWRVPPFNRNFFAPLSLSLSHSISQSPPDQLFLGDPTFLSLFVRCLNSAVIVFHYYNGVRLVEAVIVRAMVIFGREKFGRLCWRLIILVRFSRVVVAPHD